MTTNTYPTRTKSEWVVQFKENPNSVKETIEEVLGEKISSGNVDDFLESPICHDSFKRLNQNPILKQDLILKYNNLQLFDHPVQQMPE